MKKVLLIVLGLVLSCSAVVPSIDNVQVTQDAVTRVVTVEYNLKDAPGIVTMDVLTNGVSIGGENYQCVWGDLNREITTLGNKTFGWRPDKKVSEYDFTDPTVSVQLTAWATNNPPPYMSANLLTINDFTYFPNAESVIGGITNNMYKTSYVLLRKINAAGKTFSMGSPIFEVYRDTLNYEGYKRDSYCVSLPVRLTHDYYIGVYPVTQRQWEVAMGNRPSYCKNDTTYTTRPVEYITFAQIRPNLNPASRSTGGSGYLEQIRWRTGGRWQFDLPTEAQWEYAARAGSMVHFMGAGNIVTNIATAKASVYKVGRSVGNGGRPQEDVWGYDDGKSATIGSAPVGSYPPNDWGLYDMIGNVWEFCLDWLAADKYLPSPDKNGWAEEPYGPTTGSLKILRGASYGTDAYMSYISVRHSAAVNAVHQTWGFRLCVTIE